MSEESSSIIEYPLTYELFAAIKDSLFGSKRLEDISESSKLVPIEYKEKQIWFKPSDIYSSFYAGAIAGKNGIFLGKGVLSKLIKERMSEFNFPPPKNIFTGELPAKFFSLGDYRHLIHLTFPPIPQPLIIETSDVLGMFTPEGGVSLNRGLYTSIKQNLSLANALNAYDKGEIEFDEKQEPLLKKVLYGAVVSNGFLPDKHIDDFFEAIKKDKDYRRRIIKAIAFPAYATMYHEAIHSTGTSSSDETYYRPIYKDITAISEFMPLVLKKMKVKPTEEVMSNLIAYPLIAAELDAQLSVFKLWYNIQTGKKIKTVKDAIEAFDYGEAFMNKNLSHMRRVFPDVYRQIFLNKFLRTALKVAKYEYETADDSKTKELSKRALKEFATLYGMHVNRLIEI